jgi:hypothetical protein
MVQPELPIAVAHAPTPPILKPVPLETQAMKTITVRVPVEYAEALRVKMHVTRRSAQDIVRDALGADFDAWRPDWRDLVR